MPLQNDRLPSKHLQDGLALWFFFSPSNMQLKTLDSSKLLGFLTPIMWFLPKNTDTHREQHDHLLICFLMVLSLETEKCSEPFCGFTPFKLGSWCVLGLLQNGYLEIDHAKRFWILQIAQGPSEPVFCLQIGS